MALALFIGANMKWITHQTGAVAACLALEMPVMVIGAAWAGSTIPDLLDQAISRLGPTRKSRQKIFNKIHRGNSHWFGWWLGLFFCGFLPQWPPYAGAICSGVALGALSHVFMDMLTTRGVPLMPFTARGRLSLGLCSTGTWREYVFLGMILAVSAYFFGPRLLHIASL